MFVVNNDVGIITYKTLYTTMLRKSKHRCCRSGCCTNPHTRSITSSIINKINIKWNKRKEIKNYCSSKSSVYYILCLLLHWSTTFRISHERKNGDMFMFCSNETQTCIIYPSRQTNQAIVPWRNFNLFAENQNSLNFYT